MHIRHHRLIDDRGEPYPFVASPNVGKPFAPSALRFLIIHYTAAGSASGSISWFANPGSRVSAHLLVDRNGTITQMVPFDRAAFHAGRSRWEQFTGLNRHSLGIELANWGPLEGRPGSWRSWAGTMIADAKVVQAPHRHGGPVRAWERFPAPQISALFRLAQVLVDGYGLTAVLGHDDVSPDRKTDPGPLFPIDALRHQLFDRPAASMVA
ncbi:MAG: N-acetylmuramoyl-L-alanine amidase [Geminicoccaceae bacterium]